MIGIILYTEVTLKLTLKEKLIIKNKYYIKQFQYKSNPFFSDFFANKISSLFQS